jgi:dihydroxyacetone kinase
MAISSNAQGIGRDAQFRRNRCSISPDSVLIFRRIIQVGDKTMMDAILPAVQAISECTGDLSELFANAADAAKLGAKNSEQFISKFGRAKSYKEATIGTPDAGAMSASALFTGLNEGFKTYQRRKEESI